MKERDGIYLSAYFALTPAKSATTLKNTALDAISAFQSLSQERNPPDFWPRALH
jgi:hypothetical protein